MPINTLYQLIAMQQTNPRLLELAERFLMMADVFHWLLCGQPGGGVHERHDHAMPRRHDPHLGVSTCCASSKSPRACSRKSSIPGTKLGSLRADVAERTAACRRSTVVTPATHDTGAAVAAVPTELTGTGRLGLHQLGNMVADGAGTSRRRPDAAGAGTQRHQRRGHRRHLPAAQEHHGAVAGAGMPPVV